MNIGFRFSLFQISSVVVLLTQRIYLRFHSFTQHFVSRLSTCNVIQLVQGNAKEQRVSHVTLQILTRGTHGGTITSQVCSASYLTYPSECNGL